MNTDAVTSKRNIGIDIGRLIAIYFVIWQHLLGHGEVLENAVEFSANWALLWIIRAISYTSVTIFFLITCFCFSERSYRTEHVTKIWIEVLFYSIAMTLVASVYAGVDKIAIIKSVFPILFRQYGFFNNYILLVFIGFVLSGMIDNIPQRTHKIIILCLVASVSILPYISFNDLFASYYGSGALWLTLLFMVGQYIKKYDVLSKVTSWKLFSSGIVLCLLQFFIKFVICLITKQYYGVSRYSGAFYGETPLLSLVAAILIFCGFRNLKLHKDCKAIRLLVPSVFSIYLIHDNINIRKILWGGG